MVQLAAPEAEGTALRIEGDICRTYRVTDETAQVSKLLASELKHGFS